MGHVLSIQAVALPASTAPAAFRQPMSPKRISFLGPCRYEFMTAEVSATTGSRSPCSRANVSASGLFFGSQVLGLTGFHVEQYS